MATNAIHITPFVESLHDEDLHIRARAAQILGTLRNPEAVPALVDAMFDDSNRRKFDRGLFFQQSVQDVASNALLEIGGMVVVEEFEKLLQHEDRQWQLRSINLLRLLGNRDKELYHAIIEVLQGVLTHADTEMRNAAMEALRVLIVKE